jgi:hypothetical protein
MASAELRVRERRVSPAVFVRRRETDWSMMRFG